MLKIAIYNLIIFNSIKIDFVTIQCKISFLRIFNCKNFTELFNKCEI